MNTFQLKIIASNKVFFDGQAQSLIIPRLDGGSEAYLAMHENCVVPIEFGEMKIVDANGKTHLSAADFLNFLIMRQCLFVFRQSFLRKSTSDVQKRLSLEPRRNFVKSILFLNIITLRLIFPVLWKDSKSRADILGNIL